MNIFEDSSGWKGNRVQTVNYGWMFYPDRWPKNMKKINPTIEVQRIEGATSIDYEWVRKPPQWWLNQIGKSLEDVMKECIECIKKGEGYEQ